jgi:hypothetical protein
LANSNVQEYQTPKTREPNLGFTKPNMVRKQQLERAGISNAKDSGTKPWIHQTKHGSETTT